MKTIGFIGGLGPPSTLKYYEWLSGGSATSDPRRMALCILAGILVFRTKMGMLWTLALFGVLGLAIGLLP